MPCFSESAALSDAEGGKGGNSGKKKKNGGGGLNKKLRKKGGNREGERERRLHMLVRWKRGFYLGIGHLGEGEFSRG